MGKYEYSKELSDSENQAYSLDYIANELAETNRLKRLEIRLNQGLLTQRSELKEELEDQA